MRNFMLVLLSTFVLVSCDIDKKKEGEMPKVDVDIQTESGELPAYDVDWINLDMETTTKTVKVPKVKVVMEEEEIEVPYLSAQWPDEDNAHEQNIIVEAEIDNYMYELDIKDIYAYNDQLIVISELEREDEKIGDEVLRISDQVVINAPDFSVKHYIVGRKPNNRAFNSNYTYISSRNAIEHKLDKANKIM